MLLDPGELHELLGELVGVERIERVLVLELRGQQRQKGLEIAGDAWSSPSSSVELEGLDEGRQASSRNDRLAMVAWLPCRSPQTLMSTPPLEPSMRP